MSINIYTQKDNGDLKLIAEVEDATLDQAEEIVTAVLEESPRLQGPFALIDTDSAVSADVQEEEVTEVIRKIVLNGDSAAPAPKPKPAAKRNPASGSRRRSAGKKSGGSKRRSAPAKAKSGGSAPKAKSRPAIRTGGGGGLRRNNAGDE